MPTTATAPTTIPQHVLDRLESEWRQMGSRREPEQKPAASQPQR